MALLKYNNSLLKYNSVLSYTYPSKHFQVDTSGTLTTNLQHYYKLDDLTDYWGSNNLTTYVIGYQSIMYETSGNTIITTGKVGNGLYENDATKTKPAGVITTNSVTTGAVGSISYWALMKSGASDNNRTLVDGESTAYSNINATTNGLNNQFVGTTLYCRSNRDSAFKNTGAVLSYDTWTHIVFIWNGTTRKVYINNTSKLNTTSSSSSMVSSKFYFGNGWPIIYTGSGQPNYGNMDEIGIWNKELSTQEISDLYNSGNGQTMVYS